MAQINAQASGLTGSGGNNASFNLNLSGSLGSNTLTNNCDFAKLTTFHLDATAHISPIS